MRGCTCVSRVYICMRARAHGPAVVAPSLLCTLAPAIVRAAASHRRSAAVYISVPTHPDSPYQLHSHPAHPSSALHAAIRAALGTTPPGKRPSTNPISCVPNVAIMPTSRADVVLTPDTSRRPVALRIRRSSHQVSARWDQLGCRQLLGSMLLAWIDSRARRVTWALHGRHPERHPSPHPHPHPGGEHAWIDSRAGNMSSFCAPLLKDLQFALGLQRRRARLENKGKSVEHLPQVLVLKAPSP